VSDIRISGAQTAEDAAHAARHLFDVSLELAFRQPGVRHGIGYRVSIDGKPAYWLQCWRTKAGALCCAVDYT
jgi:hypothetical protein